MLLDRNRIRRLFELAELERRVTGTERAMREADVALLIKAAYDDATEAARAAFMARVQAMPLSEWPWSAVQVKGTRPGNVGAPTTRGRSIGGFSSGPPTPTAVAPPLLLLIRGEAESADVEPGNRLPDRGTPEGAVWEPLHRALDAWDTQTVTRWIGPQGWISPSGATAGQPAPTDDTGLGRQPTGGSPDEGTTPSPTPMPPPAFSWRSPAMIAVGATVASTLGVVLFSLRRRREPAAAAAREAS